MLLKNKTALIYGGSGAVGGAVARAYAREGAHVVLAARNRAPLDAVAEEIRAVGGKVDVTLVDARDPASIAAHLDEVTGRLGPVQIMFNGIYWDDVQGSHMSEMGYDAVMAPILGGMRTWFHTGTIVADHMAQHAGGVIVGITANVGRVTMANVGGFGIACAAVENFLRQLGQEVGHKGVRVCWVRSPGSPDAPGVRDAWMQHAEAVGKTFKELSEEWGSGVPLGRVTALAQVADAVTLLSSDLAAGMTATFANATGGALID
ncbi:SDR family NAD(P)-dependent oxidoreductase [Devosia sp. SL43]|uniref:SDR family NAD(P)-dependent oxidoreductase n=1 Tax=Devosia sp. SL43 TaxID=2806348 RepID=UPI001F3DD5E3|nr:SDR family NAD(P)-dependent oxidoreductase [Devosia sp. SL43]UJW86289.1 SDR family oxidoreductase [Devosia sp. SL43]